MDSLRTGSKGEGRELNHHGKTITVGGGDKSVQVVPAGTEERNADLVHRNERKELQVSSEYSTA